jgi:HD-GYP domain-containing protein (c-di-GMP phosphodiesterase class II)
VSEANQAGLRLPVRHGMGRSWLKTREHARDRAETKGVRMFETEGRTGSLGNVGSHGEQSSARTGGSGSGTEGPRSPLSPTPGRGPDGSGPDGPGPRGALAWAPWLVLAIAAAAAAIAVSSAALAIVCVLVLGGAATALGWRLGGQRRRALEQELESHSGELTRAFSELEIAQAETVRRLSMAVEFRDEDTGAHIERIGRFSTLLAEHVGMDTDFCATLTHAAPLHDVGKVAIPDAILLKPGKLTAEERAIVETHAEEGHRLLRGSSSRILDLAATIALSHHEKWDGTGYPRGVKGEAIPIEGRIVAVADVFDALTSDRIYRRAFTVEEAVEMMLEQRGRHFDPVLLDAFMEVLGRSGPDAREQLRGDPGALTEGILETFATALQRGDGETAEGAIAQAIEDGVPAAMVHDEVIEPALRRLAALKSRGELDASAERSAMGIARRVLATLRRYMLSGEAQDAEVLERIDRSVQAVEDQLATREHAVG